MTTRMDNKLHSAQTQTDGEYIGSNITWHSLQLLHIVRNHIRLRASTIQHRINCGPVRWSDRYHREQGITRRAISTWLRSVWSTFHQWQRTKLKCAKGEQSVKWVDRQKEGRYPWRDTRESAISKKIVYDVLWVCTPFRKRLIRR